MVIEMKKLDWIIISSISIIAIILTIIVLTGAATGALALLLTFSDVIVFVLIVRGIFKLFKK